MSKKLLLILVIIGFSMGFSYYIGYFLGHKEGYREGSESYLLTSTKLSMDMLQEVFKVKDFWVYKKIECKYNRKPPCSIVDEKCSELDKYYCNKIFSNDDLLNYFNANFGRVLTNKNGFANLTYRYVMVFGLEVLK